MKNEELNVNEKHVGLRTAAFVLALIIAVSAFSMAITSLGKKEPGYSTVDAEVDKDAAMYAVGVELKYYFEGSSNEIKQQLKLIREDYSGVLKRAYKLLDTDNEYEGYVNLAALNRNNGETVNVNSELYSVLKDAYAKTLEGRGFNMFAGALYHEWKSILILDEPQEFDPAYNEEERTRIEKIAAMCADLDNFTLEFVDDENCTVRFVVSEKYKKFAEEMELDCPVLDLNVLHDAYELTLVRNVLEEKGYDKGYLTASSDLIVNLSGHEGGEYVIYAVDGGEPVRAGTFPTGTGSVYSLMKTVPFSDGEPYYYTTDAGENRHVYFNAATGGFSDLLSASYVISTAGKAEDAVYLNLCMQAAGDLDRVNGIVDTGRFACIYFVPEDANRVYLNPAADAGIVVTKDADMEKTVVKK